MISPMADPEPAPQSDDLESAADRLASQGDIAGARALLEQVVQASPERLDTWLKLAAVRRAGGDSPGAQAAISSALSVDPLHLVALLSRARLLESDGQRLEAAKAYTRALAQLPDDDSELQSGLKPLVAHARQVSGAWMARANAVWDAAIDADPSLDNRHRARLSRFKSNALRETRYYHSEPTHYHYPGLREREFHEVEDFPWLASIAAAAGDILEELHALLEDRSARAEPYIQQPNDVPLRQWTALNHSLDWTAFHLLSGGHRVAENADRCPRTMAALAQVTQPQIAGRSPNAMFSLLKPHTHIPPHTGIANTRLVCHLPLIVPPDCWFRVGATKRRWVVGEPFVFDDTIEHEAANESDLPRIVLIFDSWHPDLDAGERAAVRRVMEADEAEHGAPL
ncbi:aspartyl/asparaginyl beta-hydroxylase domain-containing protein [Sphingomonas sp. AOB5]|uniref:aspartyl/asparaginyl beta-hydroxylase domain-containing protein n=1 Tax=Sphingomonas sp. AOB5 TaxID=3034017 RepID=UPI0023F719BE|nr:aspartyl/asparaginyl beta-hydroxylase domain-containing protein [Sphingomonas sp. AOB5]MDF7775093.1 aspartyl/asparaginyl beta-hydroxylase domain-containing protein [Sphingomonas sp. AOB5]